MYPSIRGAAHINAEAELIFDPKDPFRLGIRV
jgi:proline racemase